MRLRYFHKHLLVATAISAGAAIYAAEVLQIGFFTWWVWLAGALFYAIREAVQRVQKGFWDRRGLWWPVLPLSAFSALLWAVAWLGC